MKVLGIVLIVMSLLGGGCGYLLIGPGADRFSDQMLNLVFVLIGIGMGATLIWSGRNR